MKLSVFKAYWDHHLKVAKWPIMSTGAENMEYFSGNLSMIVIQLIKRHIKALNANEFFQCVPINMM